MFSRVLPSVLLYIPSTEAVTNELHVAVEDAYEERVINILKRGNIDVNEQDDGGDTALLIAVMHGNAEIVQILVNDPRTSIIQANRDGRTPLEIAREQENYDLIKILYPNGSAGSAGSSISYSSSATSDC